MNAKKVFFILLTLSSIFFSVPAFSWPLGIGVTSYYSYWKPAWSDSYSNVEIDPVFMVGPVISLTFFENFTLTWLMITNIYEPMASYSIPVEGVGRVEVESRYQRSENELTFMYTINKYIRCFVGYKEQEYIESEEAERISVPVGYVNRITYWNHRMKFEGSGAGVSLVIPLEGGMSVTVNTSVLFLDIKYSREEFDIQTPNIYTISTEDRFRAVGNNSSVALSYYFSTVNTAISLGAKFQFLRYYADDDAPSMGYDYYYGVTLAALYFFH